MHRRTCFALLALLAFPSIRLAAAAADQPIRTVIITGVDWPGTPKMAGHLWKETGPAVRNLLQDDARFRVVIKEDPGFLAQPDLGQFDLVVLMFKNYDPIAQEATARQNLARVVREGKGLVVIHFASGAFPDWPEFRELVGRTQQKRHDKRGPFTVRIVRPEHPITRGLADFAADDELFIDLAGESPIEVLATARSKITDQDHPMAFVRSYGRGRVFHTTLGHDVKALQVPGTTTLIRRGAAWAAGRPVVVSDTP